MAWLQPLTLTLTLTLTPTRLAEAFDAFDTDQSGELDYEEFVMMVSSRAPIDSEQVSH